MSPIDFGSSAVVRVASLRAPALTRMQWGLLAAAVAPIGYSLTFIPAIFHHSPATFASAVVTRPDVMAYMVASLGTIAFATVAGSPLCRRIALVTFGLCVLMQIAAVVGGVIWMRQVALAMNVALLAYYLSVALRPTPTWMLFLTAFQLLGTLALVVVVLDPTIAPVAREIAGRTWDYAYVFALAYGAWVYRRAIERGDKESAR